MDKLQNKGYTLLSVMVVMFILSICTSWGTATFHQSYESYALNSAMNICSSMLLRTKYQSFIKREGKEVCFLSDKVTLNEQEQAYPYGIYNEKPICFRFNVNGNVSKGGTLRLQGKRFYKEMAIEIGGGYFEVREIRAL